MTYFITLCPTMHDMYINVLRSLYTIFSLATGQSSEKFYRYDKYRLTASGSCSWKGLEEAVPSIEP